MGFLDLFKPRAPSVQTILPDVALNEIMYNRLPILRTDRIFLKNQETCHYIDKAIYEKKIVRKRYVRHNGGYSMPGLFKGTRINLGRGHTDVTDNIQYEMMKGILYITNQRMIFQGVQSGFELPLQDITAITPYGNCVELQCKRDNYKVFVPNGGVVQHVLQLLQ